uniref:HBS1 like translational GTPase n=1 Tax=Gallus gallus TaxID=9031 RepID=A0A8V0XPX1_CHICK
MIIAFLLLQEEVILDFFLILEFLPNVAAQFIYSRRDKPATFAEPLEEEYGYEDTEDTAGYFTSNHQLTEVDRARLSSCLDQMREVLAESVPDQAMVQAVLDSKFDVQKALDLVLSQGSKQNVKTKDEDAVIVRKTTKGDLLCFPELLTNKNCFSCAVENVDSSNKPELGNLTAKTGSACYSLIANDKMLLNVEKSGKYSSEKKGSKSSSLVLSSSSDDICKGSFCEPMNETENQLSESASVVGSIPDSEDACCSIGSNPSGSSSFKKLKCKEAQDLKSLLMQNVACDSLSLKDSIPSISSKTFDGSSNENFCSPCIMSTLGELALDNEVSHTANRKNELESFSPLAQSRKQESPSSEMAALPVLRSGNTSLADLLQEHQESGASHCYSLADLYTQSTASITDENLGTSSLSQLVSQPQTSGGMPELTGSLSSLALSSVSPLKEVENLTLSDLIAEAIEVDDAQQKPDFSVLSVTELRPSKRTNIDLSVLLKNANAPAEQNVTEQSNVLIPETKLLQEKQGKCSGLGKTNKTRRGLTSKRQDLSLSWMKALRARPSAFALTLCLPYPPKGYKRHTVGMHKAFLYSRQVQDVKPKEIAPKTAITPFDFKTASPDDIVKAHQQKAFTRK